MRIISQRRYAESISYVNKIAGTSVSSDQLRTARADEGGVPILKKGDTICILPDDEYLQRGADTGSRCAVWLAEIAEDEEPELGRFPTRPHLFDPCSLYVPWHARFSWLCDVCH